MFKPGDLVEWKRNLFTLYRQQYRVRDVSGDGKSLRLHGDLFHTGFWPVGNFILILEDKNEYSAYLDSITGGKNERA